MSGMVLLGIALWVGPYALLAIAMTRAQRRYLRACQDFYGDAAHLIGEMRRLYAEPQPDPALEDARRRLAERRRFTLTYGVVGMIWPVLFSYL